jgi:hypothetical protein
VDGNSKYFPLTLFSDYNTIYYINKLVLYAGFAIGKPTYTLIIIEIKENKRTIISDRISMNGAVSKQKIWAVDTYRVSSKTPFVILSDSEGSFRVTVGKVEVKILLCAKNDSDCNGYKFSRKLAQFQEAVSGRDNK